MVCTVSKPLDGCQLQGLAMGNTLDQSHRGWLWVIP